MAVLQLLIMSIVLLPVLPDKGYGPWQALNPYEIWLMIALVAGISFLGYAAVRMAGERQGILLSSLAGGLVSSTAVTVNLSRLEKRSPQRGTLLAAGIGFAATTMFPRSLLIATAIEPSLFRLLDAPLGAATLAGYAMAFVLWRRSRKTEASAALELRNPFEFTTALKFGLFLAFILVAARGLQLWLGNAGLHILAVVSGLADVDAINLSLSRMAGPELPLHSAATGILLAILSNTLVKAAVATIIAGGRFLLPVTLALGSALLAGLLAYGATLL